MQTHSEIKANPIWLAAFIGFSLLYISIRTIQPFDWDWLIKIVPIALLLQFAIFNTIGKTRILLTAGLIFSGIGDVLLSLDGLFIAGLGSFLLAQITYTGLFLTQLSWNTRRLPWIGLIVLYTVLCSIFIIPKTGDLQLVITAYMIAISLMAISAGLRNDKHYWLVATGALIFMISDTLIAISKFIEPFAFAGASIMSTYYAAQAFIIIGIAHHQSTLKL
ncbi:lysoplasmalogenase [Bermanella marisrubri]|uniref:Cytoplasmic membrane protein n=1 Tax=Bermanella marisrubri TaxID=207949 RepID=Q1N6U6_9GAMM|nr:lysoplasmalogenase [Bermanella marisrubri]EAT13496.1 cytoplasmic membrane protein [Oceanobacter sp. RED65] [Bermanella marisrubri]QIZ84298.1 lysoplasmalogenase [Bermanella marisrubri]